MGFLDNLKNAAGNAMNNISDTSKSLSEKARINKALKNEEEKINNLYFVIGQKLFTESQSTPAGYESFFDSINNAKIEIEKLKQELLVLNSTLACPKCGTKFTEGQQFCRGCGTNLAELQEQMRQQQMAQQQMYQQQMAQQQMYQQQMAQQQMAQQQMYQQPMQQQPMQQQPMQQQPMQQPVQNPNVNNNGQ